MTARALYRHYDNKQALLAEAIRTGQDQYQSARRLTEGETEPTPRPLNADLEDLIAAAVASRALTVLWQREARYLNEDDRTAVGAASTRSSPACVTACCWRCPI